MAKRKPAKRRPGKRKSAARMKGLPIEFFSRDDLFVAYRKAKQDVFQEKTQATLLAFADYEKHLNANLDLLLDQRFPVSAFKSLFTVF